MKPTIADAVLQQPYLAAWLDKEGNNTIQQVIIGSQPTAIRQGETENALVFVSVPALGIARNVLVSELIREDHTTQSGLSTPDNGNTFVFYDPYTFSTRFGHLTMPEPTRRAGA